MCGVQSDDKTGVMVFPLPGDPADLWGEGVKSPVTGPRLRQSSETASLRGHSILREGGKSCSSFSKTVFSCAQGETYG